MEQELFVEDVAVLPHCKKEAYAIRTVDVGIMLQQEVNKGLCAQEAICAAKCSSQRRVYGWLLNTAVQQHLSKEGYAFCVDRRMLQSPLEEQCTECFRNIRS